MTIKFFSPLSFVAVFDSGSEIRDPGSVNITIRDASRICNTAYWITKCIGNTVVVIYFASLFIW
jgi:hypothetical protein